MADRAILTLNAGSSSIKFAAYAAGDLPKRLFASKVERLAQPGTPTLRVALADILKKVDERVGLAALDAVGHRVVHGGPNYTAHAPVTPELLAELRRISPFDPEHLPGEIALIEAVATARPGLPQFACFDTAFHRNLPAVARLLPIPRRYAEQGVRRYGFHGLSYTYLMEELRRLDPVDANGRVVLAHLGSGASMAAVRRGECIDTTMAFTPAAGLVMGTRTGDLDPGLAGYLARTEGMTPERFTAMVNQESGLLGVSGLSADLRDLLAKEAEDARAADAVNMFCYEVRKRIGAYAAALGGLDALVFSGGIGENSPAVRLRACEGLGFLGVFLELARNGAGEGVISTDAARVMVRVIRTDEEAVIARETLRLLAG
jgi:acetate kinase